jgi:hypothetical protein
MVFSTTNTNTANLGRESITDHCFVKELHGLSSRDDGKRVSGKTRRQLNAEEDNDCILDCILLYSSSVGKLDQGGITASACTGLYRQKGKKNPGT